MRAKRFAVKQLLNRVCRQGITRPKLSGAANVCHLEPLEERQFLSATFATQSVTTGGTTIQMVPNSYLVSMGSTVNLTALAKTAGFTVSNIQSLGGDNLYSFTETGFTPDQMAAFGAGNIALSGLVPNQVYHLLNTTPPIAASATPPFTNMWWAQNTGQVIEGASMGPTTGTPGADIKATSAWDVTTGSPNVIVAVLDSGVDLNNPNLIDNIWTNSKENLTSGTDNDLDGFANDYYGWNFVSNTNNVQDDNGHGTAVSSIIAGEGVSGMAGVTQSTRIMPIKVADATGALSEASILSGFEYVAMRKRVYHDNIVVANMSFGGLSDPVNFNNLPELQAIDRLAKTGILLCIAAGNDGENNDVIGHLPANSSNANVITVAATDANDQLASFSDYGVNTVAIAAPGVDITMSAIGGGVVTESGTSMATPMVAGVAALLAAFNPGASPALLKAAILNGADPLLNLTGKVATGARLDALGALQYMATQMGLGVTGQVTVFTNAQVSGWAYDPTAVESPIYVQLFVNGTLVDTVLANGTEGKGHGFVFANEPALAQPGNLTVQIQAVGYSSGTNTTLLTGVLNFDNELFIQYLYQDTLNRAPDLGGLEYFSSMLNVNGGNRQQVVQIISHSPEFFKNYVDNLYATLLQRAPDTAGETNLVNALLAGTATLESTEQAFLTSGEFYVLSGGTTQGWVNSLYQLVLGRIGGSTEIAGWVDYARTHNRAQIASLFLHSTEYRSTQVAAYYANYLHRQAQPWEIGMWVNSGLDLLSIQNAIWGSLEYFVGQAVVHGSGSLT